MDYVTTMKAVDGLAKYLIATNGTTSPEERPGVSTAFFSLMATSGQRVRASRPDLGGMALLQAIGDDMAKCLAAEKANPVLQYICGEAVRCQVITKIEDRDQA